MRIKSKQTGKCLDIVDMAKCDGAQLQIWDDVGGDNQAWLITDVLPIDVSFASPLAGTDLFLCALFGGIISGVGSGLAIRYGGAMDGIEVVAVIFAKPLGLSVGTFVLILQRAAVHDLRHRHGQLDTAALLHRHLRGGAPRPWTSLWMALTAPRQP